MLNGLLIQLKRAFSVQERPAIARRTPVRVILSLTIPTGLIFSLLNYFSGDYQQALIEFIIMVFVLAPVYWLVNRDEYISLSETIIMFAAVIIFGSLLISGGAGGAGSNWMFVIPFVAFYINNQRTAWKWIGLFILIMLSYLMLSLLGYIIPFYTREQLLVFPVTFLFYTILAYIFNKIRNQYDSKLEGQVKNQTEELRGHVEALRQHALFDSLTGLPNRYSFEASLTQEIDRCMKEKCAFCVAVIDLDRFHEINNIMGHDKGDEVLRLTGARIAGAIRPMDTLARIGGDSFALIMPAVDEKKVHNITKKIFIAMGEPFCVDDYAIEMSVNIGVTLAPQHGETSGILVQRADLAMRQAKIDQVGRAVVYDEGHDPYSLRELMLFGKLRSALANGGLSLVYQPKINLNTMHIAGVEALIRWLDPEEGFIPPSEFIPMAEQTGMINQISEWVLEEAASQASRWKAAGLNIVVTVNLSPRNLLDTSLPKEIESLVLRHGLSCDDLCLEVTETAFMVRPERSLAALGALHDMGIHLSIDDFGTGYSSLAYLKNLPVDELKIDKCFVIPMLHNTSDMMIVKSAVELAHGFGLSVVAEGVEEKDALYALKEIGVDSAQGYYMSHPLSAEELLVWLDESEWGFSP